ncbi:MAG TPA: hypothetical protein VFC24_17800 [Casimicrobiaceae bacterium]|nr:hypothetical protein [Casimicrobiaceae bacterium]
MSFMDILEQYANNAGTPASTPETERHFDQVAQQAPRDVLAHGITQALASDQTPPFQQMVAQLFEHSDPQQRAGLLNQLLAAIGPAAMSSIASGAFGSALANAVRGASTGAPQVTPAQASQVTPEQVQTVAEHAQQKDPGIIDRVGSFYAQHPQVVKALGGIALAIALGRMHRG